MRSRSGCLTCRARKIKCDEQKPKCSQCRKGLKECRPCTGTIFRHYEFSSPNKPGHLRSRDATALRRRSNRKRLATEGRDDQDHSPGNRPETTTPPDDVDHGATPQDTSPPACGEPVAGHIPVNSSAISPGETIQSPPISTGNSAAQTSLPTPQASSPWMSPSLGGGDLISLLLSAPFLNGGSGINATDQTGSLRPPPSTTLSHSADREAASLLRYFSEGPGEWFDLFDPGNYFTFHAPTLAVSNPLLKYAICACTAKHLGRVQSEKTEYCFSRAKREIRPQASSADWYWIGAEYYEKAIHLLMNHLPQDAQERCRMVAQSEYAGDAVRSSQTDSPIFHSDETLAATAILSVYELLDASGPAWNRHLSGVMSLLDAFSLEGQVPSTTKQPRFSKARTATFWTFARQDFLSAFIGECHTRLDTNDWTRWSEAGLKLDDKGCMSPDAANDSQGPEEFFSNNLVFILCKIMNFIAAGDRICPGNHTFQESGPLGVAQHVLLEQWRQLWVELNVWHSSLPKTFQPCIRMDPRSPVADTSEPVPPLQQIWYAIPMCASTMQHYHMAKILLLVNKPHESTARCTTVTTRLLSYRSINSAIRFHSQEICGISVSKPPGSVRINSVQPLFVSGQCVTAPEERSMTLSLLRDIETDLGWATEYRVQQLLAEWSCDDTPGLGIGP